MPQHAPGHLSPSVSSAITDSHYILIIRVIYDFILLFIMYTIVPGSAHQQGFLIDRRVEKSMMRNILMGQLGQVRDVGNLLSHVVCMWTLAFPYCVSIACLL